MNLRALFFLMCAVSLLSGSGRLHAHCPEDTTSFTFSDSVLILTDEDEMWFEPEVPTDVYTALDTKWSRVVKYSPELLEQEIAEYAELYPDLIRVDTIGHSVEGRPLLMVTMGTGPVPVLALASIHAREYISSVLMMKDIEQMALHYARGTDFGPYNVRQLLADCTLYLIPMLNPDGVDIAQRGAEGRDSTFRAIGIDRGSRNQGYRSWKANARGVDLNRNFPHGWCGRRGPGKPHSKGFKGGSPVSEPESMALVEVMRRVVPEGVIAYHTQGEIFYMSDPRPVDKKLARELVHTTGYLRRYEGRPYGSLKDFVDWEYGVFYVCVELCPSVGPYPYPDERFYDRVWPRARYILPLVAKTLSAAEE